MQPKEEKILTSYISFCDMILPLMLNFEGPKVH